MMKSLLTLALTASAVLAAPAIAVPTTLTFDDVTTQAVAVVPNGYAGLNYNNVYVVNGPADGFSSSYGPGYVNGAVSSPYVGLNGFGSLATVSSTSPFALTSAYVTSAYDLTETATFIGYLGGTQLYSTSFTIGSAGPVLHSFNWTGIDSFTFIGDREQVVLDNVVINGSNGVPEPATWAMMLLGFGMMGMGLRRRGKASVRVAYA